MLPRVLLGRAFLAYSRRRLARIGQWMADPAAAQERLLLDLTRTARATAFGRDHGFDKVRSVRDFQERVPLREFAELEPYWARVRAGHSDVTWPGVIRRFALTSGTTGDVKHVPVSGEGLRGFMRAGRDVLSHYVAETGDFEHFNGRFLYLGGSREPAEGPAGTELRDLSGIVGDETPWFYKPFRLPSAAAHASGAWSDKLEAVATEAWAEDVRAVSGIPSWLLALFERVLARRRAAGLPAATLAEAWPSFSLLVHGGTSFEPYRPLFEALIGKPFQPMEVYVCSEGFLGIQDRLGARDLLLRMDAGVFHEFVPVAELGSPAPRRHWAGNVELGVDYALALSTASGVWGAAIGDVVRFTSLRPHRVEFAGRTAQFSNAFGEHLRASDVDGAVAAACAALTARVAEVHVAPLFPARQSWPRRHQWLVEFAEPVPALDEFATALDDELKRRNIDYAEHRRDGADLDEPLVVPVPRGTFYSAMRRAGRLGGQHKVPRLASDRRFADALLDAWGTS